MILLDKSPVTLGNVAPGVKPTDAVNVSQLTQAVSPQWGIFHCKGDYRTVQGSVWIEGMVSQFDSPIGDRNAVNNKRQFKVNVPGIYQVNCRATFSVVTRASGTMQIVSAGNILSEGQPFSIESGVTASVEMSQLVALRPSEPFSINMNLPVLIGRLTFEPGSMTSFSLFRVADIPGGIT